MTTFLQISINFSPFGTPHEDSINKHSCSSLKLSEPIRFHPLSRWKTGSFYRKNSFQLGAYRGKFPFNRDRDGIFLDGWKRKKRVVVVRFNQGFGFNGGGGGGGNNARVLGNLALAIGLIYLSVTGQLGWVLDAIVSIWLFAVLLPILGFGAFLLWAGRDVVQGTCPNCGNDFQVLKSTLNEELQLCPFCTQPFSVVENEFVSDPVKFTNESKTFGQVFNDFYSGSKKGKEPSTAVVDVEAKVIDAD